MRTKPNLQTKITNRLLSIDETHRDQGRKELIKSYLIETFNAYFEQAENKNRIIEFVEKQLNSKSPKTKKRAKELLERWEK